MSTFVLKMTNQLKKSTRTWKGLKIWKKVFRNKTWGLTPPDTKTYKTQWWTLTPEKKETGGTE